MLARDRKINKGVKLLSALLALTPLLIFAFLKDYRCYFDTRVDMSFYLSAARDFLSMKNPYSGSHPSNYGPLFPLLISPIALLPVCLRAYVYSLLNLLIIISLFYKTLSKHRYSKLDRILLAILLAVNPLIVYGGFILAQLDDLLLATIITVATALYILGKRRVSLLIYSLSLSIKPITAPIILSILILERYIGDVLISLSVIVAPNLVALYLWGLDFVKNAYLFHEERIEGFSLAGVLNSVGIHIPSLAYYLLWLFSGIIIPIYFKNKIISSQEKSLSTVRVSFFTFLTSYIFLPVLFGEYFLEVVDPLLLLSIVTGDMFTLVVVVILMFASRLEWSLVALYQSKELILADRLALLSMLITSAALSYHSTKRVLRC
ncbi:MAG: hypothetical protein ABWJ42_03090 [Sulfolobales archaeon]